MFMEKLVEVSDQEVRIDFALGCKCRANVRLRCLSSTTPIAFKLQTSSPHKFLVNPPSGLIPPLSYATFQIILKPQSQLPTTFPRSPSDKFLIRTTLAPELSESSHSELVDSLFNSLTNSGNTQDFKLKVAFVGPFLLRHAVKTGACDVVKNIIKRQNSILADLSTREAESLLKTANELDNSEDMVDLLVESNLNISTRGKLGRLTKGWTELHIAALTDRKEEISSLIRRKEGGPLDCRDKAGRTPLHLAASKGNEGSIRLLVRAGANVDAKSNDGRTALYRATANDDRRMVELLIEMGSDPTIVSADGARSAIDAARDKGHKEVVELLERGEAVLNASRKGQLKRLESLLETGAKVNYCDQYGITPLHIAAIKGHKDVVMLLAEYGSDLEFRDTDGHTPLHLAVESGSKEIVEVLVSRGADVNAVSKKGATPLYISTLMGREDISRVLLARGADGCTIPHSHI